MSRISRRCTFVVAIVLCVSASLVLSVSAQAPPDGALAPAVASYTLDVRLDPASKQLTGTGNITYVNRSGDTLSEVWLHLYLRAFRDLDTPWMREAGRSNRGNAAQAASPGDIVLQRLTLDGTDLLPSSTLTETLLRAPLPRPLRPGESAVFDVAWVSTLPRVFARTGYAGRDDTFFMVGQWYPKLAAYYAGAWDTEPWHANSEFFHDFGNYDVRVTVPRGYVLAASGSPADGPSEAAGWQTTRFLAESVSDFAFAASPDFRVRTARVGASDLLVYYLPEHESAPAEYMSAATGSLAAYSSWYGTYPHPRLSVVDVPENAAGAGGMEYPMLITGGAIGTPAESGFLTVVVAHEMAHQWFPMQVATHEGREPWLDEGFAEYTALRYLQEIGAKVGIGGLKFGPQLLDRLQYFPARQQPITRPAWQYSGQNYAGAVYSKAALGLATLENVVETERMRAALAAYVARFRWKHPTAADLRATLEEQLGEQAWFFDDYAVTGAVIDFAADPITTVGAESRASVRRVGGVRVPVEIELVHASGRVETRRWDGRDNVWSVTTSAADPFARVRVDPRRLLVAELRVTNNAASTEADFAAGVSVGGRILFWWQMLWQWLGLFG